MARSNEYTHGGSAGKNIYLLLRAILNTVAFAAFFFGIYMILTAPGTLATVIAAGGAVLLIACLWFNLIAPYIHRKK
ncbi:MAG: hypothetical protein IJV98_01425 [Clostridia bacterium]|nr:hypothetical protein [Clostridia bacterium]